MIDKPYKTGLGLHFLLYFLNISRIFNVAEHGIFFFFSKYQTLALIHEEKTKYQISRGMVSLNSCEWPCAWCSCWSECWIGWGGWRGAAWGSSPPPWWPPPPVKQDNFCCCCFQWRRDHLQSNGKNVGTLFYPILEFDENVPFTFKNLTDGNRYK